MPTFSADPPRSVTRNDLYDLVWSTPITQVARTFGISDVALAKICKKLAVPRPERGHWQRVRAGHKVRPRQLGPKPPGVPDEILVAENRSVATPAVQAAKAQAVAAIDRVEVRSSLRSAPPLVRATADALRNNPIKRDGALYPRGTDTLDLRVSKDTITRSLLIYDALIRALEAKGYSVKLRKWDNWRSKTVVVVGQEEIDVRLEEATRRVEIPVAERRWSYDRYRYDPTGHLRFTLHHYVDGVPKTISDGKNKRLEDRLGEVIVALLAAAEGYRQNRLEREEEERRRREERARAEELKRVQALEAQRRHELIQSAGQWAECVRIRAFLGAVRNRLGVSENDVKWKAVLAWADRVVVELDPLSDHRIRGGPEVVFGNSLAGLSDGEADAESDSLDRRLPLSRT